MSAPPRYAQWNEERVQLHARRYEARGHFKPYKDHGAITAAAFLTQPAAHTPVFVRFFSDAGDACGADTVRDVRGFDVRFYTTEGTYDLLGNSVPAFAAPHEAMAVNVRGTAGHWPNADDEAYWHFVAAHQESMPMLLWQMSDRTLPRSLRMMEGFGIKTFVLTNAKGETVFCKFHWRPLLGTASLLDEEAAKIAAVAPDFHKCDLFEAIKRGDGPEYELCAQVMDLATVQKLGEELVHPWALLPEEKVPSTALGVMTLDRDAQADVAEDRPLWFAHTNLVPGVALAEPQLSAFPDSASSDPARQYWLSLTAIEQTHVARALSNALRRCSAPSVRQQVVEHLRAVSETLAMRVAEEVGVKTLEATPSGHPSEEVPGWPSFSLLKKPVFGLKGRHIGILLADGFSQVTLTALKRALALEQAVVTTVSVGHRPILNVHGRACEANRVLAAAPSVLFDVVVVLSGKIGIAELTASEAAKAWIVDAFAHLKVIAHSPQARPLVERLIHKETMGVVQLHKGDVASFVSVARQGRVFEREEHVHVALSSAASP